MDNLLENYKDDSKLDFAPRERLQLCLNILPNQMSFFHYLYEKIIKKEGKSSVDKVAEAIQKCYDAQKEAYGAIPLVHNKDG